MTTAHPAALVPNLTRTLSVYFILPAFVAMLCLGVFVVQALDRQFRSTADADLVMAATAYAERIDRELASAALAISSFSRDFGAAGDAGKAFADTMGRLRRDMPGLDRAAVLSPEGDTILAAGTVRPLDAAALIAALPSARDNAGPPALTRVAPRTDGLPGFEIAAWSSIDGHARIVTLSADSSLFSALLDRERIGRTGEAFLMDAGGALLTRSVLHGAILDTVDDALTASAPEPGEVLAREWRGTRLRYTVRPVFAAPGWRLVVQRDEREILQERDGLMVRLGVFALLALATLGAAALVTVRKARILMGRLEEESSRIAEHEMLVRKLDAVSQLGVGIAHEVNNPLAIIGEEVGWMQDVLKRESFRDHPDAGELRDSLRQIVTQTARSREITHKLLSFGGKTDGTIRDTDLNALVSDVALLRRREASGKGVEILEETDEKLPVILSEPALLRQVLIILINNCLDSMPEGGTITLSTHPLPGGGARLVVRDTGFGIPRENLDRIFDPFFTTKPPGKGAGLGLSICHGIMQRIGGRIFADSVPGQGTTVTVELPLEARACITR
jgi:two-component system NtrC family sensor kinase